MVRLAAATPPVRGILELIARTVRRRTGDDTVQLPAELHPLLRRIYSARGVRSPHELELGLDRLIPVRELDGIESAVDLLLHHHARASRILVVGDFDADGATSTALTVRQLTKLGFADVRFMVPNRFQFGYGLTPEIVRVAAQQTPALIITVDNGVSSHAGVAEAQALGIETLITDHHLPGAALPSATAMVNPNLPGNSFASKSLAGVGVAFYVLAALTHRMQSLGLISGAPVAEFLDLVALGTVADLVALDFNNRILVQQGLRRIRAGRCVPGIRALLEVAGGRVDTCVAADLGFQIGPRLNAAGRLDDMTVGIQCLLTDDLATARLLAARLTQLNQDRRDLEQRMQEDALRTIAEMHTNEESLPLGLCLFEESWHQGVVGLVASRVKDRVHRPVIAMARADAQTLKGSARSVAGVHIRDVLDAMAARDPGLIDKFGGHAMAAGLSIAADRFEDFSRAFDAEVRKWMTPEDARGVLHTDGALDAGDFSLDTARLLRISGPWGQGFPEPLFDGRFGVAESKVVGERHLKLRVRALDGGSTCDAIAFRHFDHEAAVGVPPQSEVSMAFRLDVNEYAGTERLQLIVEHLEVVSGGRG